MNMLFILRCFKTHIICHSFTDMLHTFCQSLPQSCLTDNFNQLHIFTSFLIQSAFNNTYYQNNSFSEQKSLLITHCHCNFSQTLNIGNSFFIILPSTIKHLHAEAWALDLLCVMATMALSMKIFGYRSSTF